MAVLVAVREMGDGDDDSDDDGDDGSDDCDGDEGGAVGRGGDDGDDDGDNDEGGAVGHGGTHSPKQLLVCREALLHVLHDTIAMSQTMMRWG